MKKETKELISWLKEHLSHYRIELATGRVKIGMVAGQKEEERAFAAIDFLNTLPEIESHLCRGGYVQDRNGTSCCDGDRITGHGFIDGEESVVQGILRYGFMEGDEKKYILFPHWWLDLDGNASFLPEEGIEKVEK